MQFNEWAMTQFLGRSLRLPEKMYFKPNESGTIFHKLYDKEDTTEILLILVYKTEEWMIKINPYEPVVKVIIQINEEAGDFANRVDRNGPIHYKAR